MASGNNCKAFPRVSASQTYSTDDIIKDGIRVQKQFAKDMFNGLTDDEIALCKQIFKKICNNAEACIKAANKKVPAEK